MFLKQSTAYTFRHGPFLDETDGKTAETGLTISQADVRLSKAGGNFAQKNESSSSSHDEIGFYIVVLDATDTATCGELLVAVHESGALPVFKTFQVVEEAIYDALFAGSANLVTKIDAIDTVVDAVLVDTGTTIPATIATIDTVVDAILVDTGTTLNDKIDVIDGIVDDILVDTAVIGAAGAGLTDLGGMSTGMKAEVNVECDGSMVTYGLDHLVSASVAGSDVTDNSIVAKLVSKESTADWDDFANTTDSLQALRDRGDSAWTTGAGGTPPQLMQSTTIASLASQTSFTLTAGSADDDAYNSCVIIITDQSTGVQKAHGSISDYTGSSKTVTLSADPGIFTMATGDTVDIMSPLGAASSGPTAASIADAVWDEASSGHTSSGSFGLETNLVAHNLDHLMKTAVASNTDMTTEIPDGTVLSNLMTKTGDTSDYAFATDSLESLGEGSVSAANIADAVWDEATSGHVSAGTFGKLAADVLADTNEIQADDLTTTLTTIIGKIDTIDGIVDSILVDTGTTLEGKIDAIDTVVDAILVDTAVIGAAGAGLTGIPWNSAWDAEVQSEVTDAFTAYDPPTKTEMDAAFTEIKGSGWSSSTDTLEDIKDASGSGIWTTSIAESYAADGAAATPAQLLYMIWCGISEFSIDGTTITGKNLAGSGVMTWTLDDASSPTSRTRAS